MHSSRSFRAALSVAVVATAAACSDGPAATKADTSGSVTTTAANCTTPILLTVGQVSPGLSGTSVCIGGTSTSAEYTIIPFNGVTTSINAAFNVVAAGTSNPASLPTRVPTSVPTLDLLSGGLAAASSSAPKPSYAFDVALRNRERAALTPLISGARTWARQRTSNGARLDAIPAAVTVGQILRLNANANDACSTPNYRGGRVVAITNRAIVVADTGNPIGGYTDAEYASLGTTFDTLIDPLDRQAFGDPSDIDGNGRIVMFFTKTVNDLTPAGSGSYIGGFFFARDLFPIVGTADYDACATSNVGEMFYIMVPDPNRGGAFSKTNVAEEVTGTLAHEYQHLINASRRLYVNTAATDFEETWLDEGLAHCAEELLFYRVSGLQPRQDINLAALHATAGAVDAFNNYESANFGRYDEYLTTPSQYSAYADNDSLATRGATWSFLRYAVDHTGTSDGTTLYQLVNSTTTGIANLQNVFGPGVINEIRDWGTSVETDGIAGVSSAYQQPSWDFRSLFAALTGSNVFPLTNVSLTSGTHAVTLVRGANAYMRFSVPAGGLASVTWTGAPSTVQFTLVRTQ